MVVCCAPNERVSIYVSVSCCKVEQHLHDTTLAAQDHPHLFTPKRVDNAIPKMRSISRSPNDSAFLHVQANTTVPSTVNLSMTMTIQTKPKRRTKKYRPVERPDGIIIEHPRYQPIDSSPGPDLRFEKKLFSLENVSTSSKLDISSRLAVIESGFIGIGACLEDTGRDGYNDFADGGRVRRNQELPSTHTLGGVEVHTEVQRSYDQRSYDDMTPMDRFLFEAGYWSSCSRREG
jgi:hypothetical protein